MHRHRLHQNLSVDCRHYPSCQAPPQPPHLQHNRPIPIQQWSGHHAPASHCPSGAVMTPMYGLPHQTPNGDQRPASLRPPQITHHRQWLLRHDCQASYQNSILLALFIWAYPLGRAAGPAASRASVCHMAKSRLRRLPIACNLSARSWMDCSECIGKK